jgi:hypothetical protein
MLSSPRVPSCSRLALLLLGLLLFGASGCYEQNVRVVVYPDGSGRIVMTRSFTPAAVRLVEAQAASMGRVAASVRTEDMFFSEKALKADAKRLFGKGVRFVSAQRMDYNGGRGSVALYAFDKVDGLCLRPAQLMQSAARGVEGRGGEDEDEAEIAANNDPFADVEGEGAGDAIEDEMRGGYSDAYRFKLAGGAQPKLTVRVPSALRPRSRSDGNDLPEEDSYQMDTEEEIPEQSRQQLMANGNPLQLSGKETSQEIMTKLCKGLRFSLDVEVRGAASTVAASNLDPRQAGRCTLLRIDGEEVLKQAGSRATQTAQRLGYGDLHGLIGKAGVTCENRPEVTFTITPAAPAPVAK